MCAALCIPNGGLMVMGESPVTIQRTDRSQYPLVDDAERPLVARIVADSSPPDEIAR